MLNLNLEKEIAQQRKKLEKLEAMKEAQYNKEKGIEKFSEVISDICEEYGLTEAELLHSRGDKFVMTVKQVLKSDNSPKYIDRIKALLLGEPQPKKVVKKSTKPKKIKSTEPKLPIGVYVHPHTGEVIEKIKRAPKALKNWAEEFGENTVLSWKK